MRLTIKVSLILVLPLSVVDIFRFPLIFWLLLTGRVSHRHDTKRKDSIRNFKKGLHRSYSFLIRIDSGPYSAKTERLRGKKHILSCSGTVLRPVRILITSHPCGFAAYYDGKSCLSQHLGIRKIFRQSVKALSA